MYIYISLTVCIFSFLKQAEEALDRTAAAAATELKASLYMYVYIYCIYKYTYIFTCICIHRSTCVPSVFS